MTEQRAHFLKNGHPAHVFTDEDRRKAAAVTNEIRRAKRELFEQLCLKEEMERRLAAREERRRRRREKQRARRATLDQAGRAMLARRPTTDPTPSRGAEPTPRHAWQTQRPAAPEPVGPYAHLPVNERQALERGWGGELG